MLVFAICTITFEQIYDMGWHDQFTGYVAVPPSLTSTFNDQSVIEGNTLSISCAASGVPAPTYMFRKVSVYIFVQ